MTGPTAGPTAGPGVDLATTVDFIAATQQADGMIPWFAGGHGDPWNHVEAAMSLDVGGRPAEAARGYQWLAANQRPDGGWHQYYRDGRISEPTLDANVTAYVATGAWHHFLSTGDTGFLEEIFPVVARAMDFVLDLQAPGGEVIWARHADGTPWPFALLTASSSTCHSLRSASAIAARLGFEREGLAWEAAAEAIADAVVNRPEAFLPKDRWSMDWYYPVLAGIVTGISGRKRLAGGRDRFVMDGLGVRCVADKDWVTAAETCECAIAHAAVGEVALAADLFTAVQHLRADDGTYLTGMVHPDRAHFPAGERTTYSAAAVVLAADAIWGTGPTSRVFVPVGAGQPSSRREGIVLSERSSASCLGSQHGEASGIRGE